MFFLNKQLCNYTKTIIHLRLDEYLLIIQQTARSTWFHLFPNLLRASNRQLSHIEYTRLTLSVSKHDRNFLLSPINMTLLNMGTSTFNCSSIGTGAMFSPPAVMMISETMIMPSVYQVWLRTCLNSKTTYLGNQITNLQTHS